MMKKFETIGCCGIDCGLCPRFYTKGDSVCPGCGGSNFKEKHPSCGFLTCCALKKGLEVCSTCTDFPCKRFESERNASDSFVTHQKIFPNHNYIKTNGVGKFIEQQQVRTDLLVDLLNNFDDGRSKSFFCISCALLPLEKIMELQRLTKEQFLLVEDLLIKNKLVKDFVVVSANSLNISLKLRK